MICFFRNNVLISLYYIFSKCIVYNVLFIRGKNFGRKNKLDVYFVIYCDVSFGCCVYMLYNDDCCR